MCYLPINEETIIEVKLDNLKKNYKAPAVYNTAKACVYNNALLLIKGDN